MKAGFSSFNEKLFSTKEKSGIGSVGTMKLLRGSMAKGLNFIGRVLSYTTVRSYGCFLLSFGIVSLFLHLGEYYFRSEPDVSLYSLVFCAVISLMSIPLTLITEPVCIATQDFRLTDRIFFDFLSIKRMHRNVKHISISPIVAMFLGFIPAAAGYFFSVELVALATVVSATVVIAFASPEFSMILTTLLLPYLPILPHTNLLICALSAITFVSYAFKVVVGKRVFNIDTYVIIIGLTAILSLVSGFVCGDGAVKHSIILSALLVGYIPISNVIINRRLADSLVNAVIVSAIPIAVISIIEFIIEHPSTSYKLPEYSPPGTSAFFSSPSALAAFILISAIMTLFFAVENRSKVMRIFYTVVFLLEVAVLVITMQPGAWLAAIFAAVAYPIIRSRRIPLDLLALLIIIPHLLYFLPTDSIDSVYSYLGVSPLFSEKLSECGDALEIFGDNIWFGIGADGISSASNNLFGIGAELGVFVLSLFVLGIIIRFRHMSYYRPYSRNSHVSSSADMSAISIVALLVFGAFDFIFSDVTVLYLFLLVFAISTAVLRTARRENDDRLGYYGDSNSLDSSALDVSVSR